MGAVHTHGLGIVVVNYGSHALLAENLVPLDRDAPGARIVVVDNFSSAEEAAAVHALCTRWGWTCLLLPRNDGFGAGANEGASRALALGARSLLFLNPDAVITASAVAHLDAASRESPWALISPTILRPDGSTWFAGGALDLRTGRTLSRPPRARDSSESGWITGACLTTSRELWDRLDGFDTDYFLYWEDVDLSFRATAVGAELRVLNDVFAVHAEGGTQESIAGPLSENYYYYNIRNRLLFAHRNLSVARFRQWRRHTLRESWAIVERGGHRHLASSAAPYRALSRGMIDGLLNRSGANVA